MKKLSILLLGLSTLLATHNIESGSLQNTPKVTLSYYKPQTSSMWITDQLATIAAVMINRNTNCTELDNPLTEFIIFALQSI